MTIPTMGLTFTQLTVVVETKLVGVGTQAHRVDLLIEFVGNPVLNEVFCENATLRQEIVVFFQILQRPFQGTRG